MNRSKQKNLFGSDAEEPLPWELAVSSDQWAAEVVFNRPLETAFHYRVPDEWRDALGPGQRVKVPFGQGNRLTVGYCVGVGPAPSMKRSLKSVHAIIDPRPLLSPSMMELTHWIADYYLCGWGQVLDSIIPAGVKKRSGTRVMNLYQASDQARQSEIDLNLPSKQQAVLDILCASETPLRGDELTKAAGCGTGPIQSLRDKGLIVTVRERVDRYSAEFGPAERIDDLVLNRDQQLALTTIVAHLRSARHRTILLHGVTGSGKTEVYIQAIREVVGYGRQAIVLVPEISLTPQTIRRFRSRFDSVAVLHSHLSDSERHWHWQRIASGKVQVVVGARSAIFAPTPHLGLIVIDEEHETSFKQETTPRYHARDVARKRAELEQVPLILGSATPTLESWYRVQQKQDTLISLPNRVERLPLPPVVVVDVRHDPQISKGEAIGRTLETALRAALRDEGQAILFLNLRGFSPAIWCRACGESVRCPDCDVTLTWHKDRNVALCHVCDYSTSRPKNCPTCGHAGIRYVGTGTQRLEQEVRAKFPKYECLRMDSDSMRKPGSHESALERFRQGEVHILLGTQMIAKGLDFPNVTLVGVIDADTILHQPDLRSAERTFQLLAQVSGRAGRSERGGRVYVQSSCPTEPAILRAAKHDYLTFARDELAHRRDTLSPPFQRWARVILRGPDENKVQIYSDQFAELLRGTAEREATEVRILGPAPAPVAKIKTHFRYHFQLAAPEIESIQRLWRKVVEKMPRVPEVEFVIDVDPVSLR